MVGVVIGEAVIGVHLVVGHLLLQSDAGVFTVEVVAAFGEGLVTPGVDADTVQIVAFIKTVFWVKIHLSAETGFFQGFNTQLATELSDVRMVITQKNIVLRGHGVVHKRVAVAVHFHEIMAHMTEKHDAVVLPHFDTTIEIEIRHQHGIGVQIEKHFLALVGQRLLVVHINLSGDGFITISDRRSSFGDLNAVHPSAWHIVEAESRGQATEIGNDFGHHLSVDATQAEQLDLFGTRDGIAVVHIH